MALTYMCGFEMGTPAEAQFHSGAVSVQSTIARNGGMALRSNGSGTSGPVRFWKRPAGGTLPAIFRSCRFYMYVATAPAINVGIAYPTVGGTAQWALAVTPTRTLVFSNQTTPSSNTLNLNTWHLIEVNQIGTSTVELWVDGVKWSTHTGTFNSGDTFYFAGQTISTYDLYFDDLVCYDTELPASRPASYALTLLRTVSDDSPSMANWRRNDGTTTSGLWSAVDNVPPAGTAVTSTLAENYVQNGIAGDGSVASIMSQRCSTYGSLVGNTITPYNIMPILNHGQQVTTGSPKSGTFSVSATTFSNRTDQSFDFGLPQGAAGGVAAAQGAFPVGWGTITGVVEDVSTMGLVSTDAPVMYTTKTNTTTRVVSVDFVGTYVLTGPPTAPTLDKFHASSYHETAVRLVWSAIGGTSSTVTLSRNDAIGGTVTIATNVTTRDYLVTGLVQGREYTFTITVTNGAGTVTKTATATPEPFTRTHSFNWLTSGQTFTEYDPPGPTDSALFYATGVSGTSTSINGRGIASSGSVSGYVGWDGHSTLTTTYVREYVYRLSNTASLPFFVVQGWNTSTNANAGPLFRIGYSSTGLLVLEARNADGTYTVTNSTSSVPTSAWFRFEAKLTIVTSTSATCEWRLFTTTDSTTPIETGTLTSGITANWLSRFWYGKFATGSDNMYIDEIAARTTDWIGPAPGAPRTPTGLTVTSTANGLTVSWTPSASGTPATSYRISRGAALLSGDSSTFDNGLGIWGPGNASNQTTWDATEKALRSKSLTAPGLTSWTPMISTTTTGRLNTNGSFKWVSGTPKSMSVYVYFYKADGSANGSDFAFAINTNTTSYATTTTGYVTVPANTAKVRFSTQPWNTSEGAVGDEYLADNITAMYVPSTLTTVSTTSYEDTAVTDGSSYTYTVVAINEYGESAATSAVTGTFTANVVPSMIEMVGIPI